MANIFNEYGNIPHEFPLNELEQTIWDTVKDYIDKAREMGASIVDLRALESHLMGIVGLAVSENRLRTQMEIKRAKREEHDRLTKEHDRLILDSMSNAEKQRFINFYHCPECEHEWDDRWMATCDDACPQCGMRNVSPYNSIDAE